jgi:hypothetical protein
MHPILRMRRIKGGLIKTKFQMIPIKNYKTTAITNGVRIPESFKKLSIGGSAHKKEYEHPDEELGGKVRAVRIKPLKFKY